MFYDTYGAIDRQKSQVRIGQNIEKDGGDYREENASVLFPGCTFNEIEQRLYYHFGQALEPAWDEFHSTGAGEKEAK